MRSKTGCLPFANVGNGIHRQNWLHSGANVERSRRLYQRFTVTDEVRTI